MNGLFGQRSPFRGFEGRKEELHGNWSYIYHGPSSKLGDFDHKEKNLPPKQGAADCKVLKRLTGLSEVQRLFYLK